MLRSAGTVIVAFALFGFAAMAQADDVLQPNPNLHIEGIPPIPASLAARAEKYTEFRPRSLVDWHPSAREMIVATRLGATTQLYRVREPMAAPEAMTDYADPVRQGSYRPKTGEFMIFAKDAGGNEASQLYRMDLTDSRKVTQLTDPQERHQAGPWSRNGDRLVFVSTPLDKSGRREQITSELYVVDPARPETQRALASLPGGGWFPTSWSHDGRRLMVENYISAVQSELWVVDVETGEHKRLLPTGDSAAPARYDDGSWSSDDKGIFVATSRDGEFRQLAYMALDTLRPVYVTRELPWDVEEFELSEDGKRLAVVINEAGRSILRLVDADTRALLSLPPVPAGQIGTLRWRPGTHEFGFTLNSAQSPGDVYSIDADAGTLTRWTETKVEGIDTRMFRDAESISWKSFDGRIIYGNIVRPPAAFRARRPVLVDIHGGPEGQARPGFLGRGNYFVNELGVTLIQPNVRGSSGFGKTYLNLDNGVLREDSVKDIGALLDWIATQPDLDAKRVMVVGGSYGGYMSLAVATHYSDRIAAAVDIVGIANFVSFLERTESYRRDLRRVEYGDERDPQMRAFFEKISPLTSAAKIKKPLFVVHGRNDPRVPIFEAEQIIAKVRANGTPVWSLIADNEGHGFARKPNADFYFYAMVLFVERYLLSNE